MPYTLAFDVYGTLIDTSGVFETLQKTIGTPAQPFMEMWRSKQLEYTFRRGLMGRYVEFSQCTEEALNFCCQSFDLSLLQTQKSRLMAAYAVLPPFPDVKSSLQSLNDEGHRCFAFSNGSSAALKQLLDHAELSEWLEGIVSVEAVQTFKPSPKVYAHFTEVTQSSLSATWLISGNPFDIIGGASYGMRTVWVRRAATSVFDPWGIKPTHTVNGLEAVADSLPSP